MGFLNIAIILSILLGVFQVFYAFFRDFLGFWDLVRFWDFSQDFF
jgi:vacuolar-type H+-ATPase subunit I/STV1